MPDDEERIDIDAQLGGTGGLNDQLLNDLKDVAKAEQKRKTTNSTAAAKSAAKKSANKYILIGSIAAVIILIVAYIIMVKPETKNNVNSQTGATKVPQTSIAAPAATTTAPTAPMNTPPANNAPKPSSEQDADGYETPM